MSSPHPSAPQWKNSNAFGLAAATASNTERRIIVNAKTQRPSVCNAAESVLVHRSVAGAFLPALETALTGVELVAERKE